MPTVHIDRAWGEDVAEGLQRLAQPAPWLASLKDEHQVAEALQRWVPELRSGPPVLRELEAERVRLRDDTWVGQYRLVLTTDGGERTVELAATFAADGSDGPNGEPFGSPSWTCYVPELRMAFRTRSPDVALPSLPSLTDPDRAKVLLERTIRASTRYRDLRIAACAPQVMRYKPGSRCTVLYQLEFPLEDRDRGWPNPVVAKTHHGPKGRNAHESMVALWESPLSRSEHVTIAEPLGFSDDEDVLLQGPIREERTLKEQLRLSLQSGSPPDVAALRAYLGRTGRGLADLHSCGVAVGAPWRFADEMADVRGRLERLARFVPELAGAGEPVLGRLDQVAAAVPADAMLPSHRSFRPAQVLIDGDDIGFIDFDSFCQAEPALDIALFFSTFRDVSLRALRERDGVTASEPVDEAHLVVLDDLCDALLEGYQETAAVAASRDRVYLWQALLVFDRLVLCWTKNRFERLPHCLGLLQHLYGQAGLTGLLS